VSDAGSLARFKREIQYAKRVTHSNVCRIHDLGCHREGDSELVFLTMELVEGRTLASQLRESGRMTTQEALPLVVNMTEALAAAHNAGIIHRDFKTSNVMIVAAGRKAIVTDFGLARATGSSEETALTDIGKIVGTPAYMAPAKRRVRERPGSHLGYSCPSRSGWSW
jgi:eukaryotic-like serine/threonine-protein kinase